MPELKHLVSPDKRGFVCGAAVALATLNRLFDQPTMCGEVLATFGPYSEFVKAGVDDYDLEELRKIRRQSAWK